MAEKAPDERSGAVADATESNGSGAGKLLRLFALGSVLAVVAILAFAGVGVYRVYSGEMTKVAEEMAVYVGNSIFELERATLLKSDVREGTIAIASEDLAGLDERLKTLLRTFNMHKIKVFSADKSVVYSTDEKIIGSSYRGNPRLDSVLSAGTVASTLETKETVRTLKGEDRFRVDVVETYVPIRAGDAIVGAFEIYTDISSTRLRVMQTVTYTLVLLGLVLAAVFGALYLPMRIGMMRLARAENRLREQATMDVLTGIFNRRHLLGRLTEERERLRRARNGETLKDMVLLMMDIDHFKKVNDTYGHLAGDQALQEIASRIKNMLRPYDVLGRYGGEEFLAVLPATRLADGMHMAERIRAGICATPVRCGDLEVMLSVSIGVATNLGTEEHADQILGRADEGLYKAKESGRNRVCTVQTIVPE